jgi:2-iminobutanoate/2-iminopropanoate deaminase
MKRFCTIAGAAFAAVITQVHAGEDCIERIKPPGVFEPAPGLYAQIVKTTSATRYEIAGTLPYRPDGSLPESLGEQAQETMRNITRSLDAVNLTSANVVRINIYTTDMDAFRKDAINIVFDYFGDTRPASTLVQVPRLANPKVLVEIEAVAAPAETSGAACKAE